MEPEKSLHGEKFVKQVDGGIMEARPTASCPLSRTVQG